jgi:soluble lytic murein transglycosylase-like protein
MSRGVWVLLLLLGLLLLGGGGVLAVAAWRQSQNAGKWIPVLNSAESAHGIPPNLLARMAYEESHWRDDIISGATVSPAGALGIMQLEPAYFSSVNVPRPYTDADTAAQIDQAAAELARLYGVFGSWPLAVAAYNDGQGNIAAYVAGTRALPAETEQYLTDVFADVPAAAVA